MTLSSSMTNWIPYKLHHAGPAQWVVKWLDLGELRMTEPFFDETIQRCLSLQKQRSSLMSLSCAEFLTDACEGLPALEPSAFVFHVSRCGSTLVSQVFGQPEEHVVVAEAPLLDEILRAGEWQADIDLAEQERWFKAAIRLMGQIRNGKESDYIIKLDSWHLHFYDTLRQWFPDTPFFFIYRKPEEVLASHAKQRGIQAVPGMIPAALLQTDDPDSYGADFTRYTAKVLEQYFLRMLDIHALDHPGNLFFDFAGGGWALVESFSSFTGIPIRDREMANQRLGFHSKAGWSPFRPEGAVDRDVFFFPGCHGAYEQLGEAVTNKFVV